MSALADRFRALHERKRCGFIPFVVAGDPNLETTAALLAGLSELEPAAIEVGVPFSDPIADGPVIQRAAQRALATGTTLQRVLEMLRHQEAESLAPLVLFSYYNPIFQFGVDAFSRVAAECKIAGVLAVDLPAEAAAPLHTSLRERDIDLIFLVAPTTSDTRLKQIAKLASGFIYAVARTGVTGTARQLTDESEQLVRRVRALTDVPVAVGFGITNRAQARRVCRYADAAVVGSRLVAEIETESATKTTSRAAIVRKVLECARQFA
ncbi:MAG TPA: tryptophan synthase subunit alpha [Chthoniobacterales bacterium]